MSILINRKELIKKKGFAISSNNDSADEYVPVDFAKMKVGIKNLEDAIIDLGELKKINPKLTNKEGIL